MEYEIVYHHGVKGQKWGIRRTAEQLGHYVKGRKRKKQQKAALEKARAAKAEKQKQEKVKKDILDKGSASDILKIKDRLTDKEIQTAINRLNLERQLSSIGEKEREEKRAKVEKFVERTIGWGKKAADMVETGNRFSKAFKELNKTLEGDTKKPKTTSIDFKDISKLTDDQLKAVENRLKTENNILKNLETRKGVKTDNDVDLDDLINTRIEDLLNKNK